MHFETQQGKFTVENYKRMHNRSIASAKNHCLLNVVIQEFYMGAVTCKCVHVYVYICIYPLQIAENTIPRNISIIHSLVVFNDESVSLQ